MRGEAWIGNALNTRMLAQELGNHACIFLMLAHTKRQCLDATQREPGIEGARNSASRILVKLELLVNRLIVEDQSPTNEIAMPVDVLGGAMKHNIGTQCQRLLEVRAREGSINDKQGMMCMCDLGNRV